MKFDFDEWFERFWLYYPNDLCHKIRGSKPAAIKAAKKKVKTQAEADRVMLNTEAWVKYSRHERDKSPRNYTDRWPHVSKFFNQEYYDNEIPSYIQGKDIKIESKTCKHCSEPVHGPNYDVCTSHIEAIKIAHKPRQKTDYRAGLDTIKEALKG